MDKFDKNATITLFCLMWITDNLNDLRSHPVYGFIFKGAMKVAAKTLISQYDKALKVILKTETRTSEELIESYVTFCKVIEEAFTFEKPIENEVRSK